MREHGRGGSLLVVPADTQLWQESILQPVRYSVAPPFCALVDLMREDTGARTRRRWQQALHRVVEGIAGLTAVDGATVITDRYELLAFGAKILRRANCEQVSSVIVTEPIEGTVAATVEPGQLGGTRHLSAAQFAHDQRDAIALVASQDGRFTVFGWSPCEHMVHAHRIETLLLERRRPRRVPGRLPILTDIVPRLAGAPTNDFWCGFDGPDARPDCGSSEPRMPEVVPKLRCG
jgi:hypothetical protein